MEQKGEFRNDSIHIFSIDLRQTCQGDSMVKGHSFQQMMLEQTVMCGRQDSKNVSLRLITLIIQKVI